LLQEIITTYEASWDTWYEEIVAVLPDAHSQLRTFFVEYLIHVLQEPSLREYAQILRQPVSERTRDLVADINQKGEQFVGQQFTRWLKKNRSTQRYPGDAGTQPNRFVYWTGTSHSD